MKLIIAGSRSITRYEAVRQAMLDSGLWVRRKEGLEIVSGMAKGVDALGEEFAKKNSLVCHVRPADWGNIKVPGAVVRVQPSTGLLYNVIAGHIRNQQMADESDALLLIWDGKSTGSKDMLARAKNKGLEIYAYTYIRGRLESFAG